MTLPDYSNKVIPPKNIFCSLKRVKKKIVCLSFQKLNSFQGIKYMEPNLFKEETFNKLSIWENGFLNNLKQAGRSSNTLKNYKTDLTCFSSYLKHNKNQIDIEKFSLPETLEYGKFLEMKYSSNNSRRRRVQTLRLFFDYLVSKNIFNHNPVKKISSSPKFLDIPRPTSFINVKKLWDYLLEAEKNNPKNNLEKLKIKRNQLIFLLIYTGGLKVSDIQNLKTTHFIFKRRPRVIIVHSKRDPYSVALNHIFQPIFNSYSLLLDETTMRQEIDFKQIFFNANPYKIISGGISSRGIELLFKSWEKKLNFEVTAKSLRQSCIFTWIHQKIDASIIKENLGLSPAYSFKHYKDHGPSHPFSDDFLSSAYFNFFTREGVL